jgi:hypothetical protein
MAKKKLSIERRLLTAEKTIASLENAFEENLINLLESLCLRDGEIGESSMFLT